MGIRTQTRRLPSPGTQERGARVAVFLATAGFSARFSAVTHALDALPDETLIDGEVIAVDENGRPSFNRLQNFDRTPMFYAFDVPILAGDDLRQRPLDERRKHLGKLTHQLGDPIRFSETFDASAGDMIAVVREHGLEGVVAKRRDSLYESGRRSGAWVKLRVNRRRDFVVGGYIPRGRNFDSILVGHFEDRDLKYAASVRAGFRQHRGKRFSLVSRNWKLRSVPSPTCLTGPRAVGTRESRPRRWPVSLAKTAHSRRDRFSRMECAR